MTSNLRRILIIAQPFAPHSGSHATRVNGIVEALLADGREVTVLTTTLHRGIRNLDWALLEQVRGAKVHRAFCGPMHFLSYLRNTVSRRPEELSTHRTGRWKTVFIPDTYIEWVPFAVIRLTVLWLASAIRPDLIVSSAAPYSCHLVGLWAKKLFGVPWVADFGDPWVIEPSIVRGSARVKVERAMEGAVIRNADIVTWSTVTTRDAYRALYPDKASAMHVLYMGYRSGDFVNANPPRARATDEFSLAYTGRLTVEHRDASRFIDLFDSLCQIGSFRLLVAGTDLEQLITEVQARGIPGVQWLGTLDHADFVSLLGRADALVLLGNRSPLQVPGKVFQYIAARKPVLYVKNMASSERDETEQILADSGIPYLVVDSDGPLDAKQVAHFLLRSRDSESHQTRTPTHSWAERATRLLALVSTSMSARRAIDGRQD